MPNFKKKVQKNSTHPKTIFMSVVDIRLIRSRPCIMISAHELRICYDAVGVAVYTRKRCRAILIGSYTRYAYTSPQDRHMALPWQSEGFTKN